MTREELAALPWEEREALRDEHARWLIEDQKRNQIVYYQPVNPDAIRLHLSMAREFGVQGGNKSSKTGTALAEAAIQMTGIVPNCLKGLYPVQKIRPPIRVRLCVTSITNAWDINLKQKLQWFHWNGRLNADRLPGDPDLGHWGWIPQEFLIDGDWDRSWSEKHRMLTLVHPDTGERWSTLHVMSYEGTLQDFNQGAFHLILEDEIPPEEYHRANLIRAMELHGQVITGGTPSDDRSAAVTSAWFFDQMIRPGLEGSNREEVEAIVLWTENNRTLGTADVARIAKNLTAEQRKARLHGEPIHLEGLILKGFTEKPRTWCFACVKPVYVENDTCSDCGGKQLARYCHVWNDADLNWPGPVRWPTLFYMDPHQARPTACLWAKVDPQDGWWVIHEAEIEGDAAEVKRVCEDFEREHHLGVFWRKGDPKITAQRNQFAQEFEGRPFTIREAFEEVGFWFEEANTNFSVAVNRIEEALKVNPYTKVPRLRIHESCTRTIYHVTHHIWDPHGRRENQDVKEKPGKKNSDFVATLRYLAMDDPEFRSLEMMRHCEPVVIGAGGVGRNKSTGW